MYPELFRTTFETTVQNKTQRVLCIQSCLERRSKQPYDQITNNNDCIFIKKIYFL